MATNLRSARLPFRILQCNFAYNIGMVALTNNSATLFPSPIRVRAQDHRYRFGAKHCSKSNSRASLRESTYDECDRSESCSRDPMSYWGSPFNIYEYADGAPTNVSDPSGLACVGKDPNCAACDAAAALCFTIVGALCAKDLLEIPKCAVSWIPWWEIDRPGPPPVKIWVPHPCGFIQPPGSPARWACCATFAVGECAIKLTWCGVIWRTCYQHFNCDQNGQNPDIEPDNPPVALAFQMKESTANYTNSISATFPFVNPR
jgi:hypothetical protein